MKEDKGGSKDKIAPGFETVEKAAGWVLDSLGNDYQKPFWRRKNKHEEAKKCLQDGDWTPVQAIIKEEYEKSQGVLETGRINLELLHSGQRIPSSAPIVKVATFYGILLRLINQRVELTSEISNQEKFKRTLEEVGIAIETRESQEDLSQFSVPQLLRELGSLAEDVFATK